eukprot:CAMPEP_0172583242 /NCGR_PEP_ID=MMETSP1068-20121228/2841_1 /TAXON_ID=35684 /ORGANISM="Pseudopedinella elastica, Strain CCMP716" /LENGTH=791 /DNA_ID=CAMNT_0013376951 /DNA_START=116 /DNA_END=2491 /DNA_ORIENTATION=+
MVRSYAWAYAWLLTASVATSFSLRARPLRVAQLGRAAKFPALRAAPPLSELFSPPPGASDARFVFVGGKGGVGKTSSTAALAVSLADQGFKTLVVSTDPAHSLGDALAVPLNGATGEREPVAIEGCGGNLDALEVDSAGAMADLTAAIAAFDLTGAAEEIGGTAAADFVDRLGLTDLTNILKEPPPGIDELVALSQVLGVAKSGRYDRVMIDTAPTGHTLRLLAAPDFLDNFLGKLGALRKRLDGVLGLGAGMLGLDVKKLTSKLDVAASVIDRYRSDVVELKALFRDAARTEFVAVATPTPLAVLETRRLVDALAEAGIAVKHLVVNRVLDEKADAGKDRALMSSIRKGQADALMQATKPGSPLTQLALTQVPLLDYDISGVAGLRYLGMVAFLGKYERVDLLLADGESEATAGSASAADSGSDSTASWERLVEGEPGQRFVVVGGKGGVGKTSTSAALALACAEWGGHNTVVVSTDPAHSLGDALGVKLPRGELTPIAEADTSGAMGGQPGGCLYALEVDTEGAVEEFRSLVRGFGAKLDQKGGVLGSLDIGDFADVLDTAPPGLDELVALAKVLALVQQGGGPGGPDVTFDRIIIDTAPTGHTLRLLAFPRFIDDFMEGLIKLRGKLKGASKLLGMLGGGGGGQGAEAEAQDDRDRLREFQVRMYALEDLLTDASTSEFAIVTIATELAIAESERLVKALGEEHIAVRNVVVNQVLRPASSDVEGQSTYIDRLRDAQGPCVSELRAIAKAGSGSGTRKADLEVTQVPWLDVEARSVYGLRALGQCLVQ